MVTEVPWLCQFLPCHGDPPAAVKYIALLRQPKKSNYVGYYELHKGQENSLKPPANFRYQSKTCSFGDHKTEHQAAQDCLKYVWGKHRGMYGEMIPDLVEDFLKKCDACCSGTCTFLEDVKQRWEAEQAQLQEKQAQRQAKKAQRQAGQSCQDSSSSSSSSDEYSSPESSDD